MLNFFAESWIQEHRKFEISRQFNHRLKYYILNTNLIIFSYLFICLILFFITTAFKFNLLLHNKKNPQENLRIY